METLVVIFDSTDITQLLEIKDNGFEYKPFMVISAREHRISITVEDIKESQLQKEISFSTKHTRNFEELVTQNDHTATYETHIKKPNYSKNFPDQKIEVNLGSQNWLNQNTPLSPPFEKV